MEEIPVNQQLKSNFSNYFHQFHNSESEMEIEDHEKFHTRERSATDADQRAHLVTLPTLPSRTSENAMIEAQAESLVNGMSRIEFGKFLDRHAISERARASMIDWMIEVMNIFEQSKSCLFKAQFLMDVYFARCKKRLKMEDLHLVGATAMMMASKFEAVTPIKMEYFEVNICKNKYSKEQLLMKELEIFEALEFSLNRPTCFDFINFVIDRMFHGPKEAAKFLFDVSLLICQMSLFSTEIVKNMSMIDIGVCSVAIAIQTLSRSKKIRELADFEQSLIKMSRTNQALLAQKIGIVHQFVLNFENVFPFVVGVKKFYQLSKLSS